MHLMAIAFCLARPSAGNSKLARIAMMAITTSNSMRVNAARRLTRIVKAAFMVRGIVCVLLLELRPNNKSFGGSLTRRLSLVAFSSNLRKNSNVQSRLPDANIGVIRREQLLEMLSVAIVGRGAIYRDAGGNVRNAQNVKELQVNSVSWSQGIGVPLSRNRPMLPASDLRECGNFPPSG